jgi:UDP-N-acetyl-D-mannosaminuronate dehydrogenase
MLYRAREIGLVGLGLVGLGYVGLPLAVAFAEAGLRVVGSYSSQATVGRSKGPGLW